MEDRILYKHDEEVHNTRSADIILPVLFQFYKPASVVDIGCGNGSWLNSFSKLGVDDVLGVDGNYVDPTKLLIPAKNFLARDLNDHFTLDRKFDLAMSLEVAEHLRDESADNIVHTLVSLSDIVLFSAATTNQGGQNHLNEKPISFWKEKFINKGYKFYDIIRPLIWDNEEVDWWYAQNIFIASKVDLDINLNTLPRIEGIIHPKLYLYRIKILEKIISDLDLETNEFDNYDPKISRLHKLIFRLLKFK